VCPNAIINSDHSGGKSFSFQILVAVLEAVATIPPQLHALHLSLLV